MSTDESIHRIIRLKSYEQPPEGYYENFLGEFHRRQRAELLKPSLSSLILERLSSFMSEFRVPAFAYAGATAVAVVAAVGILKFTPPSASVPTSSSLASYPVSYNTSFTSQVPVTIQKTQPVSLRIDLPRAGIDTGVASSDQPFPPSYMLQAHTASHESPLSF